MIRQAAVWILRLALAAAAMVAILGPTRAPELADKDVEGARCRDSCEIRANITYCVRLRCREVAPLVRGFVGGTSCSA